MSRGFLMVSSNKKKHNKAAAGGETRSKVDKANTFLRSSTLLGAGGREMELAGGFFGRRRLKIKFLLIS
jgi:hypothetical protein